MHTFPIPDAVRTDAYGYKPLAEAIQDYIDQRAAKTIIAGMRSTPSETPEKSAEIIEAAICHPEHLEFADKLAAAQPGQIIEASADMIKHTRAVPSRSTINKDKVYDFIRALITYIPDQPTPTQWAVLKDAVMSIQDHDSRSQDAH